MTRRRAAALALAGVAAGCASSAPPAQALAPAAAASDPEPRTPEEVGHAVFSMLKRNDFRGVYARFDEALSTAMPPEQIERLWRSVVGPHGNLVAWRLRDKKEVALKIRLEYDLALEGGRGVGVVAVDPQGLSIAGLFLRPVYR